MEAKPGGVRKNRKSEPAGLAAPLNAARGQELLTLQGHGGGVSSLALSPDGRRIVIASLDTTARLWDATSGKELLTLKGHNNALWWVAFSPDSQRIFTCSRDRAAKIWEAATAQQIVSWRLEALGIPARSAKAKLDLIDPSLFYSARMDQN